MSLREPLDKLGMPYDPGPAMPWSVGETWMGLVLMFLVIAGMVVISIFLPEKGIWRSLSLVVLEPLLLLPVAIILGRKGASWKHLGFRRFSWDGMALGCGAVILMYPLVILHNLLLVELGVETQGDSITALYQELGAPVAFLAAGVLLAPIAEEIFFRGFLFPGLRQRYGSIKAMLISAAIFAGFHLQLAALIPTFLLGCVLAYTYQRSNSIWPGTILHFTINGLALCVTAFMVQQGWA
jgi:membrane protease YdiL (CAAX protease family)